MGQYGRKNYNYRHGGTVEHKREYNSWRAMKTRCDCTTYCRYDRYGGRGITYCERWKKFENFYADMGDRPDGCTLDRIDNNLGYYKDNCRWANNSTQVKNTERVKNALVTANNVKEAKCCMSTIYERMKRGWTLEEAMSTSSEDAQRMRNAKFAETLPNCIVCGKKCKQRVCKYCSVECYRTTRGKDGKFRKGVTEYGKIFKEKEKKTLSYE